MIRNKASISIDLIAILGKYAKSRQLDMKEICQTHGIDLESAIKKRIRISINQFEILWNAVLLKSNDPDFGLHFAIISNENRNKNDILSTIMSNSPTIGRAIDNLIRFHDISTDFVKVYLERNKSEAIFSWKTPGFPVIEQERHYSESIMSGFALMICDLAGREFNIKSVNFIHKKPDNITEHQRIFKCPINFEQRHNFLAFNPDFLDIPIVYSNSGLLEVLENYAMKLLDKMHLNDSFAERTAHIINLLLSKGEKPDINKIAVELAMSARSLQNKLKEENTTYQTILENLRKEISTKYLKKQGVIIYDVAFLLGFSEQSSFNHAFKKWTGMTPKDYQKLNS